ncbi:MAG: cholesterol esterase [Thelocarpon impressellum]|nr:MAG: cholesterol esterase [Thelocarpon impressellum]
MARVPLVGRLLFGEYIALLISLILVALEVLIRILTLALPQPAIRFFYNRSRSLFNFLSGSEGRKTRTKKTSIVNSVRDASDFVDICALYGYYAEEHIVQTGDGYLLGLHRLGWKQGEEGVRVNSGESSVKKRVVYLHHGILMNSEVWVCLTDKERCLPFQLVDRGYDVWLGNNRGNKYSKKSTVHSPTSFAFWNFSIDQFAFHDIPDSIAYILSTTSQPSLSYIGFSQGTAQAFAALSIHPTLNDKVNVFIALAPAMSPAGLSNGVVDALMKASPDVIFLAFGRRSILSSATMWQAILYPPIFVRIIDMSLSFLFNWHSRNISAHQKLAAYPHLYSFTSTKSVVHWFQIIRTKSFQMYDDEGAAVLSVSAGSKYSKKHKFPTRNIKTPIVLMYGGSDSLVDIDVMLRELPSHTVAKEVPHFEHLDFLWANETDTLVFPHVFTALDAYVDAEHPAARRPYHLGSSPITNGASSNSADDSAGSKRRRGGQLANPRSRPVSSSPQEGSWLSSLLGKSPSPGSRSGSGGARSASSSVQGKKGKGQAHGQRAASLISVRSSESLVGSGSGGSAVLSAKQGGIGKEGISLGTGRVVGGVVTRGDGPGEEVGGLQGR